jgi:tetratricopeptide (TPR) repeat protein
MATETKGKNKGKTNPAVLQAIGRANADGNSKQGDPLYGIEKLKLAAISDILGTDMLIDMGISYLKLGGDQGGEAVKAYQEAIIRDPKNAIAMHRIGLIYQSQNNKDLFEEYYNKAIAADATYPKTYLSLYNFYANRDVNQAKAYIEKYIQYADKDCGTEFFYADYLFRAGKYQESLDRAKAMDAGECKGYFQTPLLYAFNNDRLGDSIKAKEAIDKYLTTTAAEKITVNDFDIAIAIYSKFVGQEMAAIEMIKKAIAIDTVVNSKAAYMNKAAELMGRSKNYAEQVKWLQEAVKVKGGSMGEGDYYKLANTTLTGKDYAATMEIAKQYIAAFPEKPQGYFFNVRAAKAIDTAATLGTAVEPIEGQNAFLMKEKDKNKRTIFVNYYYLLKYHYYALKDAAKALEIVDKMLELYPDAGTEENTFANQTKADLQKQATAPPAKSSMSPKTAAPPAKPTGKP